MIEDVLKLTKELVAIESTKDNPAGLRKALERAMAPLDGFRSKKFQSKGFHSVLVYNTDELPRKFGVILNGHVDVIPGPVDKYNAVEKSGKLYGNGTMDMKAAVACLVYVYRSIAREVDYPLGLQLVTDEQQGSLNGTAYQIAQGVRGDFALMAETTNLDIVNRAKGVIWAKISIKGSSAHSAYPWKAENALTSMHYLLSEVMKAFPNPEHENWVDTINLASMQTENSSFNKIPDRSTALIDIRYTRERDLKLARLKEIVSKYKATLEIVHEEPKLDVPENEKHLQLLKKATEKVTSRLPVFYGAHGTSDATYYGGLDIPAVEFGPVGSKGTIGGESVSIESLEEYCEILISFLKSN